MHCGLPEHIFQLDFDADREMTPQILAQIFSLSWSVNKQISEVTIFHSINFKSL